MKILKETSVRNRVTQIVYQRQLLKDQDVLMIEALEQVQSRCAHPNIEGIYDGSTGNWDPMDDQYWVNLKCPDCLKAWTAYSDQDPDGYRMKCNRVEQFS